MTVPEQQQQQHSAVGLSATTIHAHTQRAPDHDDGIGGDQAASADAPDLLITSDRAALAESRKAAGTAPPQPKSVALAKTDHKNRTANSLTAATGVSGRSNEPPAGKPLNRELALLIQVCPFYNLSTAVSLW